MTSWWDLSIGRTLSGSGRICATGSCSSAWGRTPGRPGRLSSGAKTRKSGRFKLKRITDSKRVRAKLHAVKGEMARRRHLPIPEQGRWLARVLQGHYNYYAVPDNSAALTAYRKGLIRHWLKTLRRRSQRTTVTWERMMRLADQWLPQPRILHPWPEQRFAAITQGRSPVR